jgi:uncharacterized membrane protein
VRRHRDLELASVAAVLCALVAALIPWEVVRLVAALPLTLFLPGYAVIAASFGANELAPPKRAMLSVATSLMILALGAFFLNIFPFGLRTWSWAALLPLIVIAACRVAALRRGRAGQREARSRAQGPLLPRPRPGAVVLVALAGVIAAAALILAQKPVPAENAAGFTALWMLPTDKHEDAVAVGVISNEQRPLDYRLEVEIGKGRSKSYRVELDPGQEGVYEIQVPPKSSGDTTHVVASLYRENRPQKLYRRVTSWLPRQKTFP